MRKNRGGAAPVSPETLQSLVDGLARRADATILLQLHHEGATRWSAGQLADAARRLAAGLADGGIGRGGVVALFAPNSPEWIIACLAILTAGATVLPLDVQLDDATLRHIIQDSAPALIVTTESLASRLKQLSLHPTPKPVVLDDSDAAHARSWRRWLNERSVELPAVAPGDAAILFYTSGTTGPPKGVPLSHANIAFQLRTLASLQLVSPGDRLLLPLPLHHVYPFVIGMLGPLSQGVPLVLPSAVTGPQLLRAIREGRVTMIIGVPRLYSALWAGIQTRISALGWPRALAVKTFMHASIWLRRRAGLRLGKWLLAPLHRQLGPSLRVLNSGGAPLDEALAWRLEGLGWEVAIGYGLTETAPLLTLNPPGAARLGSVGRPLPGVELRIAARPDASGAALAPAGEILASGPNVFSGYHRLPERTREAFTEDGWFRTGDLGYFDADGYLHLVGRASELIKTEGGKQVQPEAVESVYLEHPAIQQIGVLQHANRLVAIIVPEPAQERGEHDIPQAVRQAVAEQSKRLPSYQRITDYVISREPLPRTRIEKLQRHLLAERYERVKRREGRRGKASAGATPLEELASEDAALLSNSAAKQVWDWLARTYPERRLTLEASPQLDLGIDSLEWLTLAVEIRQRTGVELTDQAIGRIETVRDLLREVASQGPRAGLSSTPVAVLEHPEEALSGAQRRWLTPPGPILHAAGWLLYHLNRAVMRALFRVHAEGQEHVPNQGPALLAPNHISFLDPFVLAAALELRQLRQTYWGAWIGVAFTNPVSRLVSRIAHVVPIDPKGGVAASLAFSAAVLQRGKRLIIFPEGHLSRTGTLQPLKLGIGKLLERIDVPVVPIAIQGTREALPPGRWRLRPRPVRIVIGTPQPAHELLRHGAGGQPSERIVQGLHSRLLKLTESASHAVKVT